MPAWSRNWTLRRIPAWNKPDFKSADLGYNNSSTKHIMFLFFLLFFLRLWDWVWYFSLDLDMPIWHLVLFAISLFDFWVNFFHFIQFIQHAIQLGDPELVIWGFEGPRCPFRNFDFNFRTQNLDSEFFLVDLFNYGFGFEFSFCRCSEFSADWNFFISDLNLDFLWFRMTILQETFFRFRPDFFFLKYEKYDCYGL
ncbi:unnamed protein product [Rhizophagus irregularis]|nr:unnamed protein product [Rhizophagus irregularis]